MVAERTVVAVSIQVFVDIGFGLCEGSEDWLMGGALAS
jgi:hypothetical protein